MISAQENDVYEAHVKALDRVMMNEYYFIPQWYSPFDRIAYHKRLKHPKTKIKTGADIYTWWIEE